MSIDAIGAVAGVPSGGSPAVRALDQLPQAGPGAADKFNLALEKMAGPAPVGAGLSPDLPAPLNGMVNALDRIDLQASSVSEYAHQAEASGGTLTPGEIVNLTMRCQEFMFQCQLTSNIANRSSDGVQQLFRQQS